MKPNSLPSCCPSSVRYRSVRSSFDCGLEEVRALGHILISGNRPVCDSRAAEINASFYAEWGGGGGELVSVAESLPVILGAASPVVLSAASPVILSAASPVIMTHLPRHSERGLPVILSAAKNLARAAGGVRPRFFAALRMTGRQPRFPATKRIRGLSAAAQPSQRATAGYRAR